MHCSKLNFTCLIRVTQPVNPYDTGCKRITRGICPLTLIAASCHSIGPPIGVDILIFFYIAKYNVIRDNYSGSSGNYISAVLKS